MATLIGTNPANPRLCTLPPATTLLPRQDISAVQAYIAALRKTCEPPLTPVDTFMLTVLHTRRVLEFRRTRRNAPVDFGALAACLSDGLNVVASLDPGLAREAGFLTNLYLPLEAVRAHFDKRLRIWANEANAIALAGQVGGSGLNTLREMLLFKFALDTSSERLGDFPEFIARLRAASRSASARREESRQPSDDEPAQLLSDFVAAAAEVGGMENLMMFNAAGRLVPGMTQVRDHLLTGKVEEAVSLEQPAGEESTLGGQIADERASAPIETLEDLDHGTGLERALRAFVQDRLAHEKPGTARHHVLSHLLDLAFHRITQADLARLSKLSEGAISKAMDQTRQAMLADPAIRALLRPEDISFGNQ